MNLTEQMLLREMLRMLILLHAHCPKSQKPLFDASWKTIQIAETQLSAILCLNCQESVNACQCEHTSAERAA